MGREVILLALLLRVPLAANSRRQTVSSHVCHDIPWTWSLVKDARSKIAQNLALMPSHGMRYYRMLVG